MSEIIGFIVDSVVVLFLYVLDCEQFVVWK